MCSEYGRTFHSPPRAPLKIDKLKHLMFHRIRRYDYRSIVQSDMNRFSEAPMPHKRFMQPLHGVSCDFMRIDLAIVGNTTLALAGDFMNYLPVLILLL